jgi:hypothetical protein
MKKAGLILIAFLLIAPVKSFPQDKKHESRKRPEVEQISKEKAKSKAAPIRKKTQKKMQKQRINNHNHKKTNNMWK